MLNLLAAQALVTAVNGRSAFFNRLPAIQRFRQRPCQRLQFVELVAGEKISVRQTPALQRALKQLNALRLLRKIFECHRGFYNRSFEQQEQLIFIQTDPAGHISIFVPDHDCTACSPSPRPLPRGEGALPPAHLRVDA